MARSLTRDLPMAPASDVPIRVLGSLRVDAVGAPPVIPQAGRVATLLALLAVEPGRVVSADRLMAQLWEDELPQSGVAALYVYVSRLRQQLAQVGIRVSTRPPGYCLEVDESAVDAIAFARAVARAEAAFEADDQQRAHREIETARELWTGEPFQGAARSPDLVSESARLLTVHDRLAYVDARVLLRSGHARQAGELARTLTQVDPLSEDYLALWMEAERDAGNVAKALAAYEDFRQTLAEQLGTDPSGGLRALHAELLRMGDSRETPKAGVTAERQPRARGIIGRDSQLDEIDAALDRARGGRGSMLLLEGAAGAGKTFLAELTVERADTSGFITAWTRTVESTGAPPLWPWQRVLGALPGAADATGAADLAAIRALAQGNEPDETLFRQSDEIVARVLTAARERPLCVVFDDVHWADAPTLHAIGHLASALRSAAVVVVLTVRQPDGHRPPAGAALASLAREHTVRRLPVAEFTVDEIRKRIEEDPPSDSLPSDGAAERLRERTGGNAFFLTELLQANVHDVLPASITELIQARRDALPSDVCAVLDIAAVAGSTLDLTLLGEVLGVPTLHIVRAADALCAAGLLRLEGDGYAFAHSLGRDAVLATQRRATITETHARIADAIERIFSSDPHPVLEALAYHRFRAASGSADEEAFIACTAAADRARTGLAFDVAASFRERALASIPGGDAERSRRAETLLLLTEERRAAGDVIGAASALRQALRATNRLGDRRLVIRILSLLGDVTLWNWRQYGEVDQESIALLSSLLRDDPDLSESERTQLSVALAMELYYAEEPQRSEAVALASKAVEASERLHDPVLRSRAYSALVFAHWRPDSEDRRREVLDAWLTASELEGGVPGEIVARLHRASIHLMVGDVDAWSVDIERAHDLLPRAGRAEYSAQHSAQLGGAALQAGQLHEAQVLMERTAATMRRTSMWGGEWVAWVQRYMLARVEGRVTDIADALTATASVDAHRALRWTAVLALAETDRISEARAMQNRWNLRAVPRARTWSTEFEIAQAAEVAVYLGTPLLTDAYETLSRSRSPLLMAGTGVAVLGPRDELLARLADRLGRADVAAAHRARAAEITDRVRGALGKSPTWPLTTAKKGSEA